ncbi:hypothetical protein [uncultured Rhodospira sp.]|uniref:hypothetical protein n=1 Tax=uncultured Rhodospira sp. TaxID=1936189 RepID=UPI00262E412F|nr:hypothetical protein [uncultured Rhodospira sp.]
MSGDLKPVRPLKNAGKITYLRPGTVAANGRPDPADDPMSPGFLPLDKRDDRAQARFWALHNARKEKRQVGGQFDA